MASNGQAEVLEAVRALLITNTALSNAGVYAHQAPRQDAMPYVLLSFKPMPLTRTFAGTAFWHRSLQVKVCAKQGAGSSALATAKPLQDAAYTLLTVTDGGGSPKAKLNALLVPLGFRSLEVLEGIELEPYADQVNDLERWHFGNYFDLRVERV